MLFQPEVELVPSGETHESQHAVIVDGQPQIVTYQQTTYNRTPVMLKDIRFELAQNSTGKVTVPEP